jgi:predicted nucleic acid-binding protein
MAKILPNRTRPDLEAAERGGDWSQRMEGEGVPGNANMKQAVYWSQVYTEILAMEEKVLARIRQLMETQSKTARREVELTNVPVVVAQAERFRQRLGYWDARVEHLKLNGKANGQHKP